MKAQNHHRRSIRLKDYDYTQNGAYFVTICAYERTCLFGQVSGDGEMALNEFGQIVDDEWLQTGRKRPYVELDLYVVMPNHFHGILFIMKDDMITGTVGARRALPLQPPSIVLPLANEQPLMPSFGKPVPKSLGVVIGSFKSAATKRINDWRGTPGTTIWQRNYYEEIIRSEQSLNSFREYIQTNPGRWAEDRENPANR